MKHPNGYGSIYKQSGARRKPWAVRRTAGWKIYDRLTKETHDRIPDDCDPVEVLSDGKPRFKEKQVFEYIGYYATQQEAIHALDVYNADPYDLHINTMTLQELYDKWSDEHYPEVSESNVHGCKASWNLLQPLKDMRIYDIKLDHYQKIVDESGKHSPTLKKLKITLGLMYDYAVRHEFLKQDKRDMIRYINIKKAGNPNKIDRTPFSKTEVKTLWKNQGDITCQIILIMIYSGVRINELLTMKKKDVHVEERYFDITKAKTEAGIRKVPINDKILPFINYWMEQNDSDVFICNKHGSPFEYTNFVRQYWMPVMGKFEMTHRPHDTRHTCISLLSSAGVDDKVIKKIVGHKGQGVTETVYTHFDMMELLDAINKI